MRYVDSARLVFEEAVTLEWLPQAQVVVPLLAVILVWIVFDRFGH